MDRNFGRPVPAGTGGVEMSGLSWLDDPEWSIDPEDEPTRLWIPIAAIGLAVIIAIGGWLYNHYQCVPVRNLFGEPETKCSFVWQDKDGAR